ncbi:MAG: serine hydrolase domain-containing protein, partial [Candidatus Hydrogenedentota bacterium]
PEAMAKALFAILTPGSPGVAALVATDGAIQFEGYHGLANAQHEVPVTPETPFRIASLTKPFTAAAILALAEEGRLRVEDPLAKHLPGYPKGDAITLRHLLTHSAGIPNYTAKPEFQERPSMPWTPEDIMALFKDEPLDFEPGERYSYSNSGYYLLGQIVEEVTGKSFEAYLSDRFFEPLGMRHTGMHDPRAILPNDAQGYTVEAGALKNAQEWHTPNVGGAGGMYSTVRDLHRWTKGLFHEGALTEESLEGVFDGIFMGGVPPEGLPEGLPAYGHGWVITGHRGLPMLNHMGGLPGFTSIMAHYPEQGLTVVVLSNCAPPYDLSPERILLTLAQCYFWEAMEDARDDGERNG